MVLHGFGSNMNSSNVLEPCAMFEKLGYVTLRFDMPGCGESEGEKGRLICLDQVEATSDALTFLAKHPNVEPDRIGADRLELRRRGRGLYRRRRPAGRGRDLVGRLGRRRAQVPRPASRRRRRGPSSPTCWRRASAIARDRRVADGAALRHRADPRASARPSGGRLGADVSGRDGAEHVRLPRRRRGRPAWRRGRCCCCTPRSTR